MAFQFGGDESTLSASGEERLRMLGRDLTIYGKLIREQFRHDLASVDKDTFAARYR